MEYLWLNGWSIYGLLGWTFMMTRRKASKEVFLGKLYEAYVDLCKQRGLKFENETEFVGLCDMLDASGIIAIKSSNVYSQNFMQSCHLKIKRTIKIMKHYNRFNTSENKLRLRMR